MPEQLLVTIPKTRINDKFVASTSLIDFSPVQGVYKDPLIKGRPNVDHRFHAEFYQKFGVDLVVETAMDYPYTFITEKTYRPITNGRPFIVIGPYHTLFFLRSLGFSTFSSIIDESYDDIKDPEQRFIAVCKSTKKFVDRPIDQIISDVKTVRTVLEGNQRCLQDLVNNQLEKFKDQIK
jgi:hypothetical protein